MIERISLITYGYPNSITPTSCTFVKELVDRWRLNGIKVQVINPIASSALKGKRATGQSDEFFPGYNGYTWMRYFPFLRRIQIYLAEKSFLNAVDSVLDKESQALYSHFLNAGLIAARLGRKYEKKSFCAFGESTLWSLRYRNRQKTINELKSISAYISVSSENTEQLLNAGLCSKENVYTLPNGVDPEVFHPQDTQNCRKQLGFSVDDTIGIFVGHFNDRKGAKRVDEASTKIDDLKMIYIGSGKQEPQGSNIIFKGSVNHGELYRYLNSADFFVLPTTAEGCCNAIIEALGCGLPVISSIGRFNDDLLDEQCSLRVDPMNINEIRTAMEKLTHDTSLRERMALHAENKGKEFDINLRAKKIIQIIDNYVNN